MTSKTIVEAIGILLLALVLALLFNLVSPSGLTLFKKKPAGYPVSLFNPIQCGSFHVS
jgi:hypothetical protein